ncbi:MAG: peptidylprolyl isomerase [Deltaproteobacteria bacterium]|nr:peptidylprolyl isomerase [Deltaproteobacteria bacterium]
MRRRLLSALVVLGTVACEGEGPKEAPQKTEKDAAPPAKAPSKGPAKAEGPTPFPLPADAHPAWTDPSQATEEAPASFTCQFDTTQGTFDIEVTREWAPNGADRFYNLCKVGYWDGARFFRNIEGFMVQFGMSAYPDATKAWKTATIKDDPVTQTNAPLMVTFAKTGRPDSRSTQVFINHGNNKNLDAMGFSPFGKIGSGADVVGKLYSGYGEGAPRGKGPRQDLLGSYGETYLADQFDKLDKINKTTVK